MHCASVGEYEQGRPVWAELMRRHPGARFVLSFFSPSGYEQFEGAAGHGEVAYLPWDVGRQPEGFVERLSGDSRGALRLALFVKYEWWFGFYAALSRRSVPTVLLSASVRPGHRLLRDRPAPRWSPYRRTLEGLTYVFAQDERSAHILRVNGGGDRVVLSGDTRLDRVAALTKAPLDAPALLAWASAQRLVLVAGSTWPADDDLIAGALADAPDASLLVAPHEVDEASIAGVEGRYSRYGSARLSSLGVAGAVRVVIVDSIGLLSRLYRFGQIAYVGGGFGAGIHNLLEPVAYGLPVAFGPRHERFPEATAFLELGIGRVVEGPGDVVNLLSENDSPGNRERVLAAAETYFARYGGATDKVFSMLEQAGYA